MNRFALLVACVAAAWLMPGRVTRGQTRGQADAPPAVGTVTVDLLGVENGKGQLLVALFRDGRGFPDGGAKAFATRVQKARAGVVRVTFENIPKGPFAVTVHHDEDGDFEMDTGLFGIPTEGYGFSRNAHAPFGPPDFDDCRLMMTPGKPQHLTIRLRY